MRDSPPQGDELSIGGRKPPERGEPTKQIAGRELPDGEVGAQCMF